MFSASVLSLGAVASASADAPLGAVAHQAASLAAPVTHAPQASPTDAPLPQPNDDTVLASAPKLAAPVEQGAATVTAPAVEAPVAPAPTASSSTASPAAIPGVVSGVLHSTAVTVQNTTAVLPATVAHAVPATVPVIAATGPLSHTVDAVGNALSKRPVAELTRVVVAAPAAEATRLAQAQQLPVVGAPAIDQLPVAGGPLTTVTDATATAPVTPAIASVVRSAPSATVPAVRGITRSTEAGTRGVADAAAQPDAEVPRVSAAAAVEPTTAEPSATTVPTKTKPAPPTWHSPAAMPALPRSGSPLAALPSGAQASVTISAEHPTLLAAPASAPANTRATRSAAPSTPAPAPSAPAGGLSSSGVASAAPGFGFFLFFTIIGISLLGAPAAIRRLTLASERWRPALFVLIPERPG